MTVYKHVNGNKSAKCHFCRKKLEKGELVRKILGFSKHICLTHSINEVLDWMFSQDTSRFVSGYSKLISDGHPNVTLSYDDYDLCVTKRK